jgi:3-phenylpropionate/trans-cinnamate dioxygenase ferredoxin component
MNTGKFVAAGKTGELKDGEKKKVGIGGQEIMLARVGDKYYAIANRCPHMGGDLSMGILTGTRIQCLRHGSQFDVTDGHNIRWTSSQGALLTIYKWIKSPRPVKTYRVKVEGDDILIEV